MCVLGTVTVPSAASVYNEFALKRHMDTSVHLQNFFLYFYGACFNLLGMLAVCAYKRQSPATFFAGQSLVTMALIVNNAAQVRCCVCGWLFVRVVRVCVGACASARVCTARSSSVRNAHTRRSKHTNALHTHRASCRPFSTSTPTRS